MPNYDRSTGERYAKVQDVGILTGIVALGVGIVKAVKSAAGHSNGIRKLTLNTQISKLDREIDELKNDGRFARFRNWKKISTLKKKRNELKEERDNL